MAARTLRLAHRGDWRHATENTLGGVHRRARGPGLRRPRVRRSPVGRRDPGHLPRRDPGAGPGPAGARRRADGRGARGARRPDPGRRPRGGRSRAVPRRRAQGRSRPGGRRGPERLAGRGAGAGGRVVVRAGVARARAAARPDLAVLAERATRSTPAVIAAAAGARLSRRGRALAGAGSTVRWRRRRRPGWRSPRGPSGAARPSTGSHAARASWPSASRRRRSMGGGTSAWLIGRTSWSSGRGRSAAGRRSSPGRTGSAASSWSSAGWSGWAPRRGRPASSGRRAGRRPRSRSAAGASTSTTASRRPTARTPGFRALGYLILAVTEEDERAGRERVAMQQAQGLAVTWLGAEEAAATAVTLAPTGHRGGSYLATDGAIDPPRNVRAYSLAMQAAGVELRERTAFTGAPDRTGRGRRQPGRRRRDRRRASSRPSASC